MTNWIQTKAGLQMAETINRYLPRMLVCLEELAKENPSHKYRDDIIHIAEEIDIRKQENINLKFQIDELKARLESVLGIQFEK
jgi:hypothetical protein